MAPNIQGYLQYFKSYPDDSGTLRHPGDGRFLVRLFLWGWLLSWYQYSRLPAESPMCARKDETESSESGEVVQSVFLMATGNNILSMTSCLMPVIRFARVFVDCTQNAKTWMTDGETGRQTKRTNSKPRTLPHLSWERPPPRPAGAALSGVSGERERERERELFLQAIQTD